MPNSKRVTEALKEVFKELEEMPKEEFEALMEKYRFHSFMEDVLSGKAQPSEIDDAIDGWHNSMGHYFTQAISMHDWLGLTLDEYAAYVENRKTFEEFVEDRRNKAT